MGHIKFWLREKEVGSPQKIMKNMMVIWAESYCPIQGYFWGGAVGTLVDVLF